MAKHVEKRVPRLADIRDKQIVVLRTNFKRRKSAIRYAEMVAFVQKRKGKATFDDVLKNTSYRAEDVRWDIPRGHIKVADIADFDPDITETTAPLHSQVSLQRALLWEGELSQRFIQIRSRSASVRAHCIERHGARCFVCKLDFGERFGEMFADLIEVHHKNPLTLRNGGAKTDPESACVPLCPNCHRMAHFGMPLGSCRSVDELLELFVRSEHMVKV